MSEFKANIDFCCLDEECAEVVSFDLMSLKKNEGLVSCEHCHRQYEFSDGEFIGKLEKLKTLLVAVKGAEDILGDVKVGVATLNGEVQVPYRMLLTRLNTAISIDIGGNKVDFSLRIEPLHSTDFR